MALSKFSKWFILSLALISIPNLAFAKLSVVCPSLEKAAEEAKFEAHHHGGDSWRVETDKGTFYVKVSYELCLYRMLVNLSGVVSNLESAPEEWMEPNRIGSFFEKNGKVFLKHTVILPDGLLRTLSWNLKIFDELASNAYEEAEAVLVSHRDKGI